MLVPSDDTTLLLRLARSCARNPVALHRLAYDAGAGRVAYWSDKADRPTTDPRRVLLARLTAHIPDKRQVMTRYYGWSGRSREPKAGCPFGACFGRLYSAP